MLEFLNEYAGALMVLFTAVVTLSTVVYAILTGKLVSETRLMRRAQTEPRIEVVVKPREEWISIVNLCVRNIGLGPAYDVSFDLSAEAGAAGAAKLIADFTKSEFLKHGLKYLGPGQALTSNFSQMTESFDEKITSVLGVLVRYSDSTGSKHEDAYRLDFSEFRGISQLGKPHLYAIAQSLEKIQTDVGHLESGFRRLRVDVFTEEDRRREREEWEANRATREATGHDSTSDS